jgi:hypothetical protein
MCQASIAITPEPDTGVTMGSPKTNNRDSVLSPMKTGEPMGRRQ